MKRRRRSKGKSWKPWLIVVVVGLIVVLALATYNPRGQTKIPASEYFSVSDVAAHAIRVRDDVIRIDLVQFYVTPIGGDAHEVIVFLEGNYNPLDWYQPEILNGTRINFETQLPQAIQLRDSSDGQIDNIYPMEIRLHSAEAAGYMNVNVTDPIFGPLPI